MGRCARRSYPFGWLGWIGCRGVCMALELKTKKIPFS